MTKVAAQAMVKDATSIDVVVAERLTNDPDKFGSRRYGRMRAGQELEGWASADEWMREVGRWPFPNGVRIHYRVLTRLKGNSRATFTLNGEARPLPPPPPPRRGQPVPRPTSAAPPIERTVTLDELQYFLEMKDLVDGPDQCISALGALVGEKYIIFRDAQGLPLRTKVPVLYRGKVGFREGPAIVPVQSVNDPWPKVVVGVLDSRR